MSVSDIYRIFVRFGSDTLEGKERYTVGIGKTNLTVILLDSIISQYKAIKNELSHEDYAKLLSADLPKWIKRLMSDYENWTATTFLDKYGLFLDCHLY